MARSTHRRSPLALVLLSLLAEAPMHPYRMHEVIKERGKDRVANVAQRNSVYQSIDRLQRAGLITVLETTRDERRPERTVYAITPDGWYTLRDWTADMLASPSRDYPEFPAALASLMVLSPEDATTHLERRSADLRAVLAEDRKAMAAVPDLPRLFLLDEEYSITVREAELRWVDGVLEALRSGELTWSEEWIKTVAEKFA
ncbi:PadR family transcriptional regulator [Actinophytocola algeriensis]|uniref:DNA-binding PadR family transcriptional regulator n=1 Tax=Actinophytocola algeriensis TaxID=1768010 RepID=A0A7W7Q3Q1_9PSEU|nr:PadR family transcriptional regulator [Actinophytocola algeriensis]MBB4906323.1 DNA-binding PadR family transcriptional regulator [Actinophytocola algeriensis]MBE1477804.1 DNA-binding PadR family transcriptional regulator [Actinophytocola algeriensis]